MCEVESKGNAFIYLLKSKNHIITYSIIAAVYIPNMNFMNTAEMEFDIRFVAMK